MRSTIDLDKRRKPKDTPVLNGLSGLDRIMPVLVEYTDLDPAAIRPGSDRVDLGIDSLQWVEINIELEELLGINLDADEFESLRTVGELADLVDAKMLEKNNGR